MCEKVLTQWEYYICKCNVQLIVSLSFVVLCCIRILSYLNCVSPVISFSYSQNVMVNTPYSGGGFLADFFSTSRQFVVVLQIRQ